MAFVESIHGAIGKLTGLFGGQTTERVVGIDIGTSAIKVVQVARHGGAAVLETYGALALGPYGNVEVGRSVKLSIERTIEALRDLFREANVTTKQCAISIPLTSSLITYMEMPNLDAKRLATIIPIEARKYIPVPISEVSLDWIIIPRDPSTTGRPTVGHEAPLDRVDVLLVAIHNETLEQYGSIATSLELSVKFVEIEIFSTARAILDKGVAPMMVLDMGASSTKLYLVEHGVVRTSHIVNRGSQDLTTALATAMGLSTAKAEEQKRSGGFHEMFQNGQSIATLVPAQLDYIFSEANRVLLNYERKYNKAVSKIILTGGGALLPGLLEGAQERFETEVIRGNPFSKLETPAFLSEMLAEAGPEFGAAVGVALRALQE
jgi:type IV pilus assembly protein PilM